MRSRLPNRCATPLLALIVLALSGCASAPSAEPPLIARLPRLAPLPQAILRIDLTPSTISLQKGLEWLQTSEKTLDGATPK